jgi:hypothetical protein
MMINNRLIVLFVKRERYGERGGRGIFYWTNKWASAICPIDAIRWSESVLVRCQLIFSFYIVKRLKYVVVFVVKI